MDHGANSCRKRLDEANSDCGQGQNPAGACPVMSLHFPGFLECISNTHIVCREKKLHQDLYLVIPHI